MRPLFRKISAAVGITLLLIGASSATAQVSPTRRQQPLPAGVTPEIQQAIHRGAEYLRRAQSRGGAVTVGAQHAACPVAMTALAGMAFLGEGSTPTRGTYWRQIREATRFLIAGARADGLITSGDEYRPMYGHGFATMFLAQIYGMEEDALQQQRLHGILTRAVRLIARSQSALGGWEYYPDSGSDEGSVTVTQMQALRACRNAGITVPIDTVRRAVAYIHQSANGDGSIRYRAQGSGPGRPAITAAAVAVLYHAGRYEDPIAEKALVFARRHLAIRDGHGHHFYAQLYLAQSLYHRGGKAWEDYYSAMSSWLLEHQRSDGSWMGDDVGPTYGTAIALTILQLPHSLVPIYQR